MAVADPEQQRPKLLKMIAEDVHRTREAMGGKGNVSIGGLQGPVLVRQADDRNVELFINYWMTVEMEKPGM